jgi:hypothetical protein
VTDMEQPGSSNSHSDATRMTLEHLQPSPASHTNGTAQRASTGVGDCSNLI